MPKERLISLFITDGKGSVFSQQACEEIAEEIESATAGSKDALEKLRARGQIFDYKEMIKGIVSVPLNGDGFLYDEMKRIGSILDAIEGLPGGSTISLPEQDWVFVRDRIAGHRYPAYSKAIINFVDSIMNASPVIDAD